MKQRMHLAVSIGLALAVCAGSSLAQGNSSSPAPAKPAAPSTAKTAKGTDAAPKGATKATAERTGAQAVKPAATQPSTAAEDRRFKSCHDRDSDA